MILFDRIVHILSVVAWRYPRRTVAWIALVTAMFGWFAIQLQIDASILGSLNDEDEQVVRLKEIRKAFPASGAMALLIEGEDSGRLQEATLDAVARLETLPQVASATARIDGDLLVSQGLLNLDDDGFSQVRGVLEQTQSALTNATDPTDLGLNERVLSLMIPNPFLSTERRATTLVEQLEFMSGRGANEGAAKMAGLALDNGWIRSETNGLYVVDLRTTLDPITDDIGADAFAPLAAIGEGLAKTYPDLDFNFAGMSAVAAQDQAAVLQRVLPLSTVSLLLVLFLLWKLNRSITTLWSVGLSLLTALVWTFGLVHLVIGYASIMVVGFAVLLFGLGIDHAAHLLLRMNEALREGVDEETSIRIAWTSAGRGVLVGGGTTAMAFACMSFIDFKAAVHLGLTAAMGTLCTLLLMMTMLPALLSLTKGLRQTLPAPPPSARWIESIVRWSQRNRFAVLGGTVLLSGVGMVQCNGLELETDLEQVMTSDLPALKGIERLKQTFGVSTEAVYSTASSLEELRQRAKALEAFPEIARVEGLHTLIPSGAQARIERNRALLPVLDALENAIPTELNATQYEAGLRKARDWVESWEDAPEQWSELKRRGLRALERLEKQTLESQVKTLREVIGLTRTAVQSATGTEASLPEEVVSRYRSKKGYLALIYPSDTRLDSEALSRFRTAVQSVDPKAAGGLFVVDYLLVGGMDRMRIALGAILFVLGLFLFIDLKRPKYVLLALVPVICGSFIGLSVVLTLGQPMTLVMLSAFPLIFGIGIDDGVHILHRYLEGSRNLPGAIAHVGQAILFTTLSTAISFAVLLGLNHNGFRGLAILVISGVFACFISSVTVIPVLMTWFGERGES